MKYPIYLDYNSTTPCDKEVIEAMMPWFGHHFGNAASKSHPYGWMAEDAVETSREHIANLIGAKTKEIVFTSGATESINLALKGIFEFYQGHKQHYITCKTEHKAVLDTFRYLESKGAEVTYLSVNKFGEIDLDGLKSEILPHTKMLAFMWANNETGLLHPMTELMKIAEERDLILFTDAVQAAGKIPILTKGIHLMAISAHKMYGPKGVGALYIRHNHHLPKPLALIEGGGHEKGFRSGTLNVPGIVGFGKAAQLRFNDLNENAEKLGFIRDKLEKRLLSIKGAFLNGSQTKRLSHVSNIAFSGVEGEELLRRVNKEIAVSSGSACTSILPKPSHVLAAMGLESDLGRASIRFSLGKDTSEKDIEYAAYYIEKVIKALRGL
ncbi:cysteine desulfurase family protein [Aquiflexum sp.]|uniref:cysteine desulfurase family protein n=1 Tax=Aquiflexum sp. TaxID=1872584 RepID=UPI003592F9C3